MTIGVPCADSGSQGAGGALRRIATSVSSRGADSVTWRKASRTAFGLRRRPGDRPAGDLRPDLVETERELGHDAEVAAAAPQRPEQLGVLVARRAGDRSVGQHDLDPLEVVDGPTEAASQVAEAATERQAGDAGERDEAECCREAMLLRRPIDVAQEGAGLNACQSRLPVNLDGVPPGQVQRHAAVRERQAGDVVSATPDRELETVLRGEAHGAHDIVDRCRVHDDRGSLGDRAVPDRDCSLVPLVAGLSDPSLEVTRERVEARGIELDAAAVKTGDCP